MGEGYIPIINREETCKVYIVNVLFIEQDLRKIIVHTEDGLFWRYGKIEELLKYLDDRFFKCHKSCIINLDKVMKMKEQTVFFENGDKIVMSKEKFRLAKQNFAGRMLN